MATKQRKTPLRTCVACRATRPKKELIRVVRTADGTVSVDPSGKMSGRGASVCPTRGCVDEALTTGVLARSLQVSLDKSRSERLCAELTDALEAGCEDE